ncbi:MAG: chloride channel protein [Fidelibacterota bacterium]|nr:MAG: chloride channel protein [Candidatus Neomarinimicrobiota bacterium]
MSRFARFVGRLHFSEGTILVLTSVLVGIGAGIGAVVFRLLIQGVEWVGYDFFPSLLPEIGKTYVIIIPALGGVLVGLLVYHFAREAKGHGVPEVMEAVAVRGGRIRPAVAIVKSLASSICIGSGGSVGREGPIVQIGSAIGSTVGQAFRLSDDRIRNLVACGAAGGIAATFNAPIAGVIFALEIILGEFSVAYFSTVVISAVSASVVGQAVFGDLPAFPIPMEYHIISVWEYTLYPILGLLAALVGIGFTRALYWSEDIFAKWKAVPEWVQPAIGGAILGILALAYPMFTSVTWERLPQIFNVGYDIIDSTLRSDLVFQTVLLLLILKVVATSLTLGSGGSGGVFAPSIFMGAMLGGAFGAVVNTIMPFDVAPPGAYALVGMAAVFAAAAHAPIAAVMILFELTGDYRIILPLMLTVVVATLISGRLMKGESIYTLKLSRRGVHLKAGRDVDILQGVFVHEVMTTEFDAVNPDMTIVDLSEYFSQIRYRGLPVIDQEGDLWGMVSIDDLEEAIGRDIPRRSTVAEIGAPLDTIELVYPDDTIGDVLVKMEPRGMGRLPVVSPANPRHLMGVIRHEDAIRAYNIAIARRTELQHRMKRLQFRESESTQVVHIPLSDKDAVVGKTIGEISSLLPADCILVSIERDSKIIIPHGTTTLQAGDRLTAFTRTSAIEELFRSLKS